MSDISLQEMLRRGTLPRKPLQLSILRQAAAQLDQAHQRGLVHGNLNPQCILVSEIAADDAVSVRIIDFGTKFVLDPAVTSGSAPPHAYYLSPEQILGIDVTPQSDQFSFAAIAYEVVSGEKPFLAPSLSGLIFAICTDAPLPAHHVNRSLKSGVSDALNHALAKERELRYSGCRQFMSALEGALSKCEGWTAVEEPFLNAVAAEPRPAFLSASAAASAASDARVFAPPQPTVAWQEPKYEPPAARTDIELPPLRRKPRQETEEPAVRAQPPLKKFAITALVLFLLAGAAAYYFNRPPASDLPTQVLDARNGPVSPPPANKETSPPSASAASSSPAPPQHPPAETAQASAPETTPAAAETQQPSLEPERHKALASAIPAETAQEPVRSSVEMLSEPPGASFTVDNNSLNICRAPCTMSLRRGRHTVAARLDGFNMAQRIFNVPEDTSVFVALPKLTGALVVTSNPAAATILVDGKDFGLTPATLHLPPGQHNITLMNGAQRHDATVTVVADGIQATGFTFPK